MLRVLLPSHTNSKYIVLLVFFALIMAHTLQVFTLKGCTIHWISRITFPLHGKVWMSSVFSFSFASCFAVTVHRSQGQTLNRVVFYLRKDVFMHGCLYEFVGLSRVRKSADIRNWTTEDRICPSTFCAK